ncbi:hypothetical protein HPB49_013444 [Dermacentor silvarum]|uniref:Uncharacterized protein n=1 Tax=Dermacentor silvarum TaxID=543639 RepID=A0ACB8CRD4_DERSI|nr:hypothetical protein HPB49_013444 [Dermacentor silvarum]
MSVKRAAQLLSRAVTAALKLLREQAGHTCDASFARVGPTALFMDTMYRWFVLMDVSNCTQHIHQRNPDSKQFESESDDRLEWNATTFLNYLEDMKRHCLEKQFLTNETHAALINNASTTVTGPGTATLAVPARPPGWKSEPVQYKLDQLQCVPTGRQTDGYDIKYTASYLPVHGESEKEEIKPGRQNKEALAGCTRAMKNDSFSQRQASLAVLSISLIIMVTVFVYFELSAICPASQIAAAEYCLSLKVWH